MESLDLGCGVGAGSDSEDVFFVSIAGFHEKVQVKLTLSVSTSFKFCSSVNDYLSWLVHNYNRLSTYGLQALKFGNDLAKHLGVNAAIEMMARHFLVWQLGQNFNSIISKLEKHCIMRRIYYSEKLFI